MNHFVLLVVPALAVLCGAASAGAAAFDHHTFCAGIAACLGERPAGCADADCVPRADIDYDADFCEPIRALRSRGLQPASGSGRQAYWFLTGPLRVEYRLDDTVPLPLPVTRYLFEHLDFAAEFVNAYAGTTYSARYENRSRTRFRAANGKNVSGTFSRLLSDPDVLLGHGWGKFLMWTLYGVALVSIELESAGAVSTRYRLHCTVFPGSRVLRRFMNMLIVRKLVEATIRSMIDDAVATVARLRSGDTAPLSQTAALQQPPHAAVLQDFCRLNHQPVVPPGQGGS